MTTPDAQQPGGATETHAGGLAEGPGDDQGERQVIEEAERGEAPTEGHPTE
jgi:hypothetical protein